MEIKEYTKSDIRFIKIINKDFIVTLCDLGASIFGIEFDGKYMTQTLVNEEDFKNKAIYYGKTIGRSGNRIPGDSIIIEGTKYLLEANEGKNTLHGGENGFSYQTFNYDIEQNNGELRVIFKYLSKNLGNERESSVIQLPR